MLTFRAFLAESFQVLTLDEVKHYLRHVPGDSVRGAFAGGFFILPDGSVWESESSHVDAFVFDPDSLHNRSEVHFYRTVSANQLILAHSARAYECVAAMTNAQSSRIVDAYKLTNAPGHEPNMLYIDITGLDGKERDSKIFNDRVTADALRAWVNSHF